MHRQRKTGVKRKDVVRDAGRDLLHPPEHPTPILDDLEPDELERVVGVAARIGQVPPRDSQLLAAMNG